MTIRNWAGNLTYGSTRFVEPTSMDELSQIVRGSDRVRVLGSRHSFSDIADTTGTLVSLARMPRVLRIDRDSMTATVDGGVRYGEICADLETAGVALHNLASLPHISIAGACATGTHGSGDRNGNLATAVIGLRMLTSEGAAVELSRASSRDFAGQVVALGALGVVTELSLGVLSSFRVRQDLYENLSLAAVAEHFDDVTSLGDSVSLFTDWQTPMFEQVWIKRRVPADDDYEPAPTLYGATRATEPIHPIRRMSADACTEQLGVPGAWYDRLPHFRMDHTPSAGDELQSEYFVPRWHAVEAMAAIHALHRRFDGLLQIAEVRTIAADDLWMSPAYGRPSVALHFTWFPDRGTVAKVLPRIEEALRPFEPRPHWGKVFTMSAAEVRSRYERLPEFADLARRLDPDRRFRNPFVDRVLGD